VFLAIVAVGAVGGLLWESGSLSARGKLLLIESLARLPG
jgi:hypothetical protein